MIVDESGRMLDRIPCTFDLKKECRLFAELEEETASLEKEVVVPQAGE